MNRAQRRQGRKLSARPKAMKLIEAQVNGQSADELHAKLVAQGIARVAPADPADLYAVQCSYVRIAKLRRIPIDDAFRAVEHEVHQATGLGMPTFR